MSSYSSSSQHLSRDTAHTSTDFHLQPTNSSSEEAKILRRRRQIRDSTRRYRERLKREAELDRVNQLARQQIAKQTALYQELTQKLQNPPENITIQSDIAHQYKALCQGASSEREMHLALSRLAPSLAPGCYVYDNQKPEGGHKTVPEYWERRCHRFQYLRYDFVGAEALGQDGHIFQVHFNMLDRITEANLGSYFPHLHLEDPIMQQLLDRDIQWTSSHFLYFDHNKQIEFIHIDSDTFNIWHQLDLIHRFREQRDAQVQERSQRGRVLSGFIRQIID